MAESEIARLRQQIAEEYRAAQAGLSGLASGTSKHTFITTRMERMGLYHEQIARLVGNEHEAAKLVAETLENL